VPAPEYIPETGVVYGPPVKNLRAGPFLEDLVGPFFGPVPYNAVRRSFAASARDALRMCLVGYIKPNQGLADQVASCLVAQLARRNWPARNLKRSQPGSRERSDRPFFQMQVGPSIH
jgi:hypothetical protein